MKITVRQEFICTVCQFFPHYFSLNATIATRERNKGEVGAMSKNSSISATSSNGSSDDEDHSASTDLNDLISIFGIQDGLSANNSSSTISNNTISSNNTVSSNPNTRSNSMIRRSTKYRLRMPAWTGLPQQCPRKFAFIKSHKTASSTVQNVLLRLAVSKNLTVKKENFH